MTVAVMQQTFQEKVEALRTAKGMRKADLARAMDVQPQYLTRYLAGGISPGLDVVEKFASALEVDPWLLLDNTPVEKILRVSA